MNTLLSALIELLFPAHCLGCEEQLVHQEPPLLCASCRKNVLSFPSFGELPPSPHQPPFAFDQASSFFLYKEPISSLIIQLKFNHNLTGLSTFAALVQPAVSSIQEPDLFLPVPLHIRRLRERGFNQALLLAQACFPQWRHKIHPDLLQRHRATPPQTRLDGRTRLTNLHGAFSLAQPEAIKGQNILVFDDVFTTGATLHECAKVLHAAGAKRVVAVTLARTVFKPVSVHSSYP